MIFDQFTKIHTPHLKEINFFLNGGDHMYPMITIKMTFRIHLKQIKEILQRQWELQFDNLRLFNHEGVEIFEEDVPFLKDGTRLYASQGEEFDTVSTISEYEIKKVLGEGGFGQVLLGQHRITGQKVAIKLVNSRIIGNAQDIDMVFREAELLKSLDHKNIVKIYSCYTLSNMQVVFIMEYLEGGELLQYLEERGQLSESEARIFFLQISDAMNYCHSHKLIHRDLKLENILLANSKERLVKIVDFGIAGMAINMNVEKMNVGSLKYMAPEILSGLSRSIGPAIDVWALGIILYVLVCGELPFSGKGQEEIVDRIINCKYKFPPQGMSPALKDLLSRIFVADHHKRIKLGDIIQHPWLQQYPLQIDYFEKKKYLEVLPEKSEEYRPIKKQQILKQILKPDEDIKRSTKKMFNSTQGHISLSDGTIIPLTKSPNLKQRMLSIDRVRNQRMVLPVLSKAFNIESPGSPIKPRSKLARIRTFGRKTSAFFI